MTKKTTSKPMMGKFQQHYFQGVKCHWVAVKMQARLRGKKKHGSIVTPNCMARKECALSLL